MKLNKKKILFIGLVIILLVIIVLVSFLSTGNKTITLDFESRVDTLKQFKTDYYKIGWLQVSGTNIDLPILDSTATSVEPDYSFGWRSDNYETGENREVLLGHNVINVSSNPMLSNDNLTDFESLMSFSHASFAKDNLYIQYTKNGKDELYLIYAIGFYSYNYDSAESFNSDEETKEYIEKTIQNSIYDYDVDVNSSDTLLTVKTCTRYFGANTLQQFVVDARKVREDEEIVKYNVKTNKKFDELIGNKGIDS